MPDITTVVGIATGTDDATYSAGAFSNTQVWHWTGRSTSSSASPYNTYRFQIPTSVDPALITDVRLKLYANTSGTAEAYIRVNQSPSAAPASTGSERPDTRWTSIGSTGEVGWSFSCSAAGEEEISPDISARVVSALASIDQATEYLGVHVGPNLSSGTAARCQMVSQNGTTPGYRPVLVITESVPATDASVTTTAPSAGFTAEAVTTFRKVDNVSYDDGTGDADRRFADLYIPFGTPPAGGWPVVMFAHGGGFNAGSEDDLSGAAGARAVRDSIGKGFALMSVRYKRTDFFFDNNLGWTRPHSVQDVLCAAKWIDTQSTYDLNSAFIVGLGYSAGGHLIMESALLAEDSTPNSYDAVYRGQSPGGTPGTTGPLGDRYTSYPALSHTGGRTGIPTFKGVFSMGGPWDLPQVFADNTPIIGVLGLYYGARPSTGSLVNSVGKEGDLGSFVEGRTGTIYDARTATPPSFPIGITYSTSDTTVPTSCSYTPMRSSLDTVGYDVSQDSNGNVATGVALSRLGYAGTGGAGGHDTIPTQYDSAFYTAWLDEVIALQASGVDDSVTTTAPSVTAAVGTAVVTLGNAVTTTAPAASLGVGTAAVTTARAVTSVAPLAALSVGSATATPAQPVTTTAPELTVGVGATVGSAARSDAVTTTAPAAALGVGAAAAGISAGATTTAPGATTSVGATTVSVSCAVTTTAPGVALSAALPAVTCSVSVQLSAAVVSSAVPVPVVGTAASSSTTITAPAVASTVPSVTVNISVSVSVTTTAPAVATQAGTPLTQGDVAVAVMAAAVGYSLGVLSAEALGLVFYAFTGSEHVPAQLRYTDGAGLDVPVTLELAE